MNQTENTPVYRFCDLNAQQLEALRGQLGLQMSVQMLAHCASYYRSYERRQDPTVEVLRLLDALAALPAPAAATGLRELYTNDAFAAATYADMMNKRRELSPSAAAPITIGEALGLASAYLNRAGKSPELPHIAPRLRFEEDGTLREMGRNGAGSAPDSLSGIRADGTSDTVRVERSDFSLLLRTSELPAVAEGDQFLILHRGNLPMWKYRPLAEAFVRRSDIAGGVKRILTIPQEGLLPALLRLCRGFCCDLRRLLPVSPAVPLSTLVGHYADYLLLALPAQHAKAVATAAAQAGFHPLLFAYVASGTRASLVSSPSQTVSLETSFLASLFSRSSVIARLPDEAAPGRDAVDHTPTSAAHCHYLLAEKAVSDRLTVRSCTVSAAHAQTGSAFFRTALRTALAPVLSLAAAGKDYSRQRLAVGLKLPAGPLSPEQTGEAVAAILGLYRVQTELGLPASTASIQTDRKAEHPALTVFAYAAGGSAPGQPSASGTQPSAAHSASRQHSPLPSRLVSVGNHVYCVAPAVGGDGLPDFALLRRLLTDLGAWHARGAIHSARVICGECLTDALASMSGGGRTARMTDPASLFGDQIPLAILLESGDQLPFSLVAEVIAAPEEQADAQAALPPLTGESLIWSDPCEAVLVADRADSGARSLAARLTQHGFLCSVLDEDTAAGPLSRAILTARLVVLCGEASLPDDERVHFALNTQQAAGGLLLSVGARAELPPELPAIRYPDGIPEALFDRILGL